MFASLAEAAKKIPVGDLESFSAVHCDPMYCAGETPREWRFDVIRNDAVALIVSRQYQTRQIDLTEYRGCQQCESWPSCTCGYSNGKRRQADCFA